MGIHTLILRSLKRANRSRPKRVATQGHRAGSGQLRGAAARAPTHLMLCTRQCHRASSALQRCSSLLRICAADKHNKSVHRGSMSLSCCRQRCGIQQPSKRLLSNLARGAGGCSKELLQRTSRRHGLKGRGKEGKQGERRSWGGRRHGGGSDGARDQRRPHARH